LKPILAMDLRPVLRQTHAAWQTGLARVLARPQFILGPEGEAFDQEFAAATGAAHSVGVSSGTSAIELSLRDAGVQGEVLTTALTAPFTAVAIQAAGCTPRFADIDPETLQIDAADAADRISRRTRALLPVHLYGQLSPIAVLSTLARARQLVLIQDACQAHGLRCGGRPLTSFSHYVCYSFYPTKNLGCLGDGGAVATNRAAVARRLRRSRDGGRIGQVAVGAGVNARLDEVQACYLRAALPHLLHWNAQRARLAAIYDQALSGCSGVTLVCRDRNSVHHLYVIRAKRRDQLRRRLADRGIGSGVHYPVPLHLHPAFAAAQQKKGSLPHAERACREIVSLPLWPGMSESDALRVAETVRGFYR
jgi:dTDP-3-amino-3,4,6-trideoxy-alpha-D-glucose transaminase